LQLLNRDNVAMISKSEIQTFLRTSLPPARTTSRAEEIATRRSRPQENGLSAEPPAQEGQGDRAPDGVSSQQLLARATRNTSPHANRDAVTGFQVLYRCTRNAVANGLAVSTLGFTSCRSGEGVTSVAAEFALFAARKSRVLLLNCNESHGAAGKAQPRSLRLRAAGSHEAQSPPALTVRSLSQLAREPESGARMSDHEFQQILAAAKQGFDLTVFDLPALEADDLLLDRARLLDAIAFVVEAEKTPCRQVEMAIRLLQDADAKLLGIVLNKHRTHIPAWLDHRI
jgi:Mrp family chromosome partitioning ATPase